jgi:hypothetical protein
LEHNQVSLKQIASESVYASVGTFTSTQSLDILCAYLKHNKPFLDHFKDIIFSVNGEQSIIDQIQSKVKQILNATIHIVVSENLGHTFGTFLSDYKIFEYSSQLPYNYVWKFSNDVLVDIEILDKIVTKDVGFYYVNNIGYNVFNTYSKEELPNVLLNQQFYYPQTNYYIIKNNIQFLPDENTIIQLRNKYQEIQRTQPNIQPWHAIEGCDCEHMLAKTVEANNLSKEYLLSEYSTNAIVDFIHSEKIHDGSHKNIAYAELGNLCHYHYLGHPVAVLG